MSLDDRWRALLESGRAEWRPGMRGLLLESIAARCVADDEAADPYSMPGPDDMGGATPDWTDAATLGALLGQVRERWGEPGGPVREPWLEASREGWRVIGLWAWWVDRPGGVGMSPAPTKAEALVFALERAPEVTRGG